MSIQPPTRPRITEQEARAILASMGVTKDVSVLMLRGYYKVTMGNPLKNDRNVYDDAVIVVSPTGFVTFNGNVDPSIYRKNVASVSNGVWLYKPGMHGITFNRAGYPYPAFVQASKVKVHRDGVGEDTGWFGINIHKGGINTTSSLGCMTIPPSQWDMFYAMLRGQLTLHKQSNFQVAVTDA